MYIFYIDESGNRDPQTETIRDDGTRIPKEWLYVLTAVSLFEHRWHGFEKTLNRYKNRLMARIYRDHGLRLQLADCEVKSSAVRVPKQRDRHRFLSHLKPDELQRLVELYYRQLAHQPMWIFSVIVDKRYLRDYMDHEKLHRKSWELLCESIEMFMRARHNKHQAVLVADDVSREMNRSLAMKHAFFQDRGTTSGLWLTHLCEMPLFVRSELSNGVQLADLCGYNIHRAFRDRNLEYPFFERIARHVWSCHTEPPCRGKPIHGLRIFPPESPLTELRDDFEQKRAPTEYGRGSQK